MEEDLTGLFVNLSGPVHKKWFIFTFQYGVTSKVPGGTCEVVHHQIIMKNIITKFKSLFFGSSEPEKKKPLPEPRSRIIPLEIPLAPDEEKGWKPYPLFDRYIKDAYFLSSHASVLMPGHCPHPPHKHEEEEILILLAGEVDLLLPEDDSLPGDKRRRLMPGDFVYYPAGFPHTLESVGKVPANYLMFKWSGKSKNDPPFLPFRFFDKMKLPDVATSASKFSYKILFEGKTAYLGKLQCHFSYLPPGAGYDPHVDDYDVAIILFEGEVETLGARAKPHDVIFYVSGEFHGMFNPGPVTAKYLVFEFHRMKKTAIR